MDCLDVFSAYLHTTYTPVTCSSILTLFVLCKMSNERAQMRHYWGAIKNRGTPFAAAAHASAGLSGLTVPDPGLKEEEGGRVRKPPSPPPQIHWSPVILLETLIKHHTAAVNYKHNTVVNVASGTTEFSFTVNVMAVNAALCVSDVGSWRGLARLTSAQLFP